MKKLTLFNALFNYDKANIEIENLTVSNNMLLKKVTDFELQKSKLEKDLIYMTSEMKKFKSLGKTLNDQIEQLNKTIEELSKTDNQPDVNINVTTSDIVNDTVKTENAQPKPNKINYKKKK